MVQTEFSFQQWVSTAVYLNFYSTYCITELSNTCTAWIKSQARVIAEISVYETLISIACNINNNNILTFSSICNQNPSNLFLQSNNASWYKLIIATLHRYMYSIRYNSLGRCVRFDSYCLNVSAQYCKYNNIISI